MQHLLHIQKIQTKFLLAMFCIITISLPSLGYMLYNLNARIILSNYQNSYQANLESSSTLMDSVYRNIFNTARIPLYNNTLLQYLENEADTSTTKRTYIENALNDLLIYLNDIQFACIIDNSNTVYYAGTKYNLSTSLQNYHSPTLSKTKWYQTTESLKGAERLWSYDLADSSNKDNLFTLTKQLKDPYTQENRGILVLNISTSAYKNVFPRSDFDSAKGSFLILDNQSFANHMIYTNSNHDELNKLTKTGTIFSEKQLQQQGYVTTKLISTKTDWTILHIVKKEELLRDSNLIKYSTFFYMTLMFLIAFLISFFLSRAITNPLARLRKMITNAAKGQQEFSDLFPDDEVGQIANHFKEVIGQNKLLSKNVVEAHLRQKDAELKLLQAQINPHFLYNTLNTIYWQAMLKECPDIAQMSLSLSKVFKLSLNKGDDITTIRNEMEQIENYLIIETLRYKDKFHIDIDISKDILDCKIIKLILQPFVENAIVHGLEPKNTSGHLYLKGKKDKEDIVFLIEDDGIGMQDITQTMEGFGINNVQKRIALHYGENYKVTIKSKLNQGTIVSIRIPFLL